MMKIVSALVINMDDKIIFFYNQVLPPRLPFHNLLYLSRHAVQCTVRSVLSFNLNDNAVWQTGNGQYTITDSAL